MRLFVAFVFLVLLVSKPAAAEELSATLRDINDIKDPAIEQAGLSVAYFIQYARGLGPKSHAQGFCSGFLVGPDLVVTAGHCVEGFRSLQSCEDLNVVFNYRTSAKGQHPKYLPHEVYACKEILVKEFNKLSSVGFQLFADYALIRLDRPVKGRKPLVLQKSAAQFGASILGMGHAARHPLQVSQPSTITNVTDRYFSAHPPISMGGMSGGPVFNADTMEVIGINAHGFFTEEEVKAASGATRVSLVEPYLKKALSEPTTTKLSLKKQLKLLGSFVRDGAPLEQMMENIASLSKDFTVEQIIAELLRDPHLLAENNNSGEYAIHAHTPYTLLELFMAHPDLGKSFAHSAPELMHALAYVPEKDFFSILKPLVPYFSIDDVAFSAIKRLQQGGVISSTTYHLLVIYLTQGPTPLAPGKFVILEDLLSTAYNKTTVPHVPPTYDQSYINEAHGFVAQALDQLSTPDAALFFLGVFAKNPSVFQSKVKTTKNLIKILETINVPGQPWFRSKMQEALNSISNTPHLAQLLQNNTKAHKLLTDIKKNITTKQSAHLAFTETLAECTELLQH